jgi:glycine/sarcosine/betaine reductase complex component C subunit beta
VAEAALLGASYALFHVPDLVRYGSKPSRQIARDPEQLMAIRSHLRSYESVVAYPPNQAFIGNLAPEALEQIERPRYRQPMESAREKGAFGRIFSQRDFYTRLAEADAFNLVHFSADADVPTGRAALTNENQPFGWVEAGHPEDASQTAEVILENLACKASAIEAARLCLAETDPKSIDYVINTGEEAIGDRYQRGGGNLAKAVAEAIGCTSATGADVKAFCCAPAHALILAAAAIRAGLYERVLVIGGGSLAKLGMKYEGHLRKDMPVMEDVLAAMAFLLGPEDGQSPVINLEGVGRHSVGAGSTPQAIYTALVSQPLKKLGLRFTDVDRYAVELHDPDVTEPAGSGNVPLINYRAIAALAVMDGQLTPPEMPVFVRDHGLPGYVPTQGHIPSGVPYLGHARAAMLNGTMQRAMVIAKGSLFLGKMTQLADGMSFMLEAR